MRASSPDSEETTIPSSARRRASRWRTTLLPIGPAPPMTTTCGSPSTRMRWSAMPNARRRSAAPAERIPRAEAAIRRAGSKSSGAFVRSTADRERAAAPRPVGRLGAPPVLIAGPILGRGGVKAGERDARCGCLSKLVGDDQRGERGGRGGHQQATGLGAQRHAGGQRDGGGDARPGLRAADPGAERHQPEQVQRRSAQDGQRPGRAQLIAGMGDHKFVAHGGEQDPGDDRQMQVRVGVAAHPPRRFVGGHPPHRRRRLPPEVEPPQRHRRQERHAEGDDDRRREADVGGGRSVRTMLSPNTMITNSWKRSAKWPASISHSVIGVGPARQPVPHQRGRQVDAQRRQPQRPAGVSVGQRAADPQGADRMLHVRICWKLRLNRPAGVTATTKPFRPICNAQ